MVYKMSYRIGPKNDLLRKETNRVVSKIQKNVIFFWDNSRKETIDFGGLKVLRTAGRPRDLNFNMKKHILFLFVAWKTIDLMIKFGRKLGSVFLP